MFVCVCASVCVCVFVCTVYTYMVCHITCPYLVSTPTTHLQGDGLLQLSVGDNVVKMDGIEMCDNLLR